MWWEEVKHEYYKEVLFEKKQFWRRMDILCTKGDEIYSMHVNKISISPFDTKCWIADDSMLTLANGYSDIKYK